MVLLKIFDGRLLALVSDKTEVPQDANLWMYVSDVKMINEGLKKIKKDKIDSKLLNYSIMKRLVMVNR